MNISGGGRRGTLILAGCLMVGLILGAGPSARAERSHPLVKLETSMGDITLELYPDKAPVTVANFLEYVKAGFFNGTIFHRVIPGFMIQGGGLDAQMNKKPTRAPIKNEADNGLTNDAYTTRHGPDQRPRFGHGPVFHQRGQQHLSQPHRQDAPGMGLRGVRQGSQGQGSGG